MWSSEYPGAHSENVDLGRYVLGGRAATSPTRVSAVRAEGTLTRGDAGNSAHRVEKPAKLQTEMGDMTMSATQEGFEGSVRRHDAPGSDDAEPEGRSAARLLGDVSEQAIRLVRIEARLAVREVLRKTKRGAVGGGLAAVAAVLVFYAVGALAAGAVLALALTLPAWSAALIVGGSFLVIAGLLALAARTSLRKAVPMTPEATLKNVQEDINAAKGGTQS